MSRSDSNRKQRITIIIADRKYQFSVPVDMENSYRTAAKRINDAIDYYRENFNSVDMQDIMSMSYFNLMLKIIELEQNKEYNVLLEEIDRLNTKLADYLKNDKD